MFNATNYLITIVELKAYAKDAETVFSENERTELVNFLAEILSWEMSFPVLAEYARFDGGHGTRASEAVRV